MTIFLMGTTLFAANAQTIPDNPLVQKWTGPYGGVPSFDKMNLNDIKPALEKGMALNLEEIDPNFPVRNRFDYWQDRANGDEQVWENWTRIEWNCPINLCNQKNPLLHPYFQLLQFCALEDRVLFFDEH